VLLLASVALVASGADSRKAAASWAADNGNETYSNPLFYDEFSDPDMIRVGSDYYLTGTTMHTMPGLPVLHSRDLVNWRIVVEVRLHNRSERALSPLVHGRLRNLK
jgi:beta-xylosidase